MVEYTSLLRLPTLFIIRSSVWQLDWRFNATQSLLGDFVTSELGEATKVCSLIHNPLLIEILYHGHCRR